MEPIETAANRAKRIPSRDQLWLVAIILLAAVLRFYKIGQQSLWTDEVESIWSATQVGYGMKHFFHGPLHAVLLQFWSIWWGMSDVWTRCLSAVIGLTTIPLLYLLGRRLAGGRVALLAAFLLAVSPFHIWYSQEVRNYALLIGLATASQLLFVRMLEDARLRHWVSLGLLSMALLLCNTAGIFLIAVQGMILLVSHRRHLVPFVVVHLIVAVVLLPWVIHCQTAWDPGGFGYDAPLRKINFHPLAIPFAFSVFSVGFTVGPSLNELNQALSFALLKPHLWYFIPTAILFGMLAVQGWRRRRGHTHGTIFYTIWLGLPLLLISIAAVLNIKVFNVRYIAVSLPGYMLLLAQGLTTWRRPLRVILTGLLVLACGFSIWNHYYNERYWKPDARSLGQYVNERVAPGDGILVYTTHEPFLHYYAGEAPVERIPWGTPHREDRLNAYLNPRLEQFDRLWLVNYRGWYLDPENRIETELKLRWRLVEEVRFVGTKASLFERVP